MKCFGQTPAVKPRLVLIGHWFMARAGDVVDPHHWVALLSAVQDVALTLRNHAVALLDPELETWAVTVRNG